MNSLKIPGAGLLLGVDDTDSEPKTQQAFTLDLNDDVIEGMIRCHQEGGDIQLALGATPTFHYGSQSHRISSPTPSSSTEDELPSDLYLTQALVNIREATRVPVMSMFLNNKPTAVKRRIETVPVPKKNPTTTKTNDKKSKSLLQKPTTASSKLSRDGLKSSARAPSASPALKPIASPALKAVASPNHGSVADQNKLDRIALVHELAIQPQSSAHLREKWQKDPASFDQALKRIADEESGKWVLRNKIWQELDPWTYDYTSTNRQAVISAAQKKFDKLRISPSDPLWDKLVPKNERGQGKGANLSKVQKRINDSTAAPPVKAPKIAVSRADDSSHSSRDNDDASSEKSKGGEEMARTNSNKGKKPSASEAQAKRLLSKTKAASTPKTSPNKTKAATATTQSNGKKVLSAEIIENSDSSGDDPPSSAPAPKLKTKTAAKPTKPAEKPKTTDKPAPKKKPAAAPVSAPATTPASKPAPKPVAKPAPKRTLAEDDDGDSSSSSGMPLAKRIKADKPVTTSQQRKRPELQQRPRDYSRYNKSTSPTKSSPLASSPPTNASDMSSSNDDRLAASSKRKAVDDGRGLTKRQLSDQLVERAQGFKKMYAKYEALHHELARMTHPPQNKVDQLVQQRRRLEGMKKRIYDEQESLVRV